MTRIRMNEEVFLGYKEGHVSAEAATLVLSKTYERAIYLVARSLMSAYGVGLAEAVGDATHAAWELLESWKPERGPLRTWLSGGRLKLRTIDQVRKMTGVVKGNDATKNWGSLELTTPEELPSVEIAITDDLPTIDERDLLGVVPGDNLVKRDLFQGFKEGNKCKTAISDTAQRYPHISRKEIRRNAHELRRDLAQVLRTKYPRLLEGRPLEGKSWGESRRKFRLKIRRHSR